MPRTYISYEVADVSAAARSLRQQLRSLDRLPSHVELLNMLARAASFRNFQQLRAQTLDRRASRSVAANPPPPDLSLVAKAARYFDPNGRLTQWPAKDSIARLCLWVIWARLPIGIVMSDRTISDLLKEMNTFGDHALLRRALVDYQMVERTPACQSYRRIERTPPALLAPLLQTIGLSHAAGLDEGQTS
ncbi:MAG: DUF2087 domain-containing protein [Erythrobacter sp.]